MLDAHQHFWDPDVGNYPWMTGPYSALRVRYGPEELRPHLIASGVSETIVVQVRADTEETEDLLRLAAAPDFIVGVVGWLDLTNPRLASAISRLRGGPGGSYLVGLRHDVASETDERWLLRRDVQRGLADVAAAGLSFDLEIRTANLPAAAEVAARIPDLHL